MIEVVGIGIATGDREDARAQDIGERVSDTQRIAVIRDHTGQRLGQPELLVGTRQQQHAAVRGETSAIKGGGDFFAADGWQRERQQGIVVHGGCGSLRLDGR